MNLLSNTELRKLIAEQERPCVSIYLPTIRAGDEVRQNSIRFKNLLRQAEDRLVQAGYRAPEARTILEPGQDLLVNESFWQRQSDGLAFFISGNTIRYYCLPLKFEEKVLIGDSFHIKPLLPLFINNGRFFVLAVSQQAVRLLEGTRESVDQIDLDDVPESLAEALRWDDPESQLQHYSSEGPSTTGGQAAMFHGHGIGKDDSKTDILRYFQMIDRGLKEMLAQDKAPLVLAGVDYLHPIYREANSYAHLTEEGLTGNPDEMKSEELHKQAWKIVEPFFRISQDKAVELYNMHKGSENTSEDLANIVPAAIYGQVSHLFVEQGVQQWGIFDPETGEVKTQDEQTPENSDLLDLAASHTYVNGGEVYVVPQGELPSEGPAAAVMRWPEQKREE